jgi:hypothetical protein
MRLRFLASSLTWNHETSCFFAHLESRDFLLLRSLGITRLLASNNLRKCLYPLIHTSDSLGRWVALLLGHLELLLNILDGLDLSQLRRCLPVLESLLSTLTVHLHVSCSSKASPTLTLLPLLSKLEVGLRHWALARLQLLDLVLLVTTRNLLFVYLLHLLLVDQSVGRSAYGERNLVFVWLL